MAGSIIASVAPYHIITYGTALGTTFFHTFVTTVVMIRSVDLKTFQEVLFKLWPYYFGLQAATSAVLALTTPGSLLTHSGISGFLAPANRWGTLVPIAATFVSSLANLFVALPATIKLEQERYGQGKRDGKEWFEKEGASAEMKALNRKFDMLHGLSASLNLTSFFGLLAYGFTLARRFQ
ncbi:uncharacterized protein TrAtP1_004706 [Trichoderma atroviride]|uniref:TMEM205-like domain-containing protein n=1 Tax=Hypocrea atroviridis (strain ATCC 20476 / IMI 206040) TaxID=452589 RepID=G9P524_HYPAI|nr:uncharacterized protein TRIATDRAFT_301879 [Trichoderma atroviride IMI 206040]EHK41264.1 hypothetical protein TRIATDRAFT_301879 [Trichoderma atroviride IMI 206040]UKZ63477.1 hypothetical protein TrAtP1_004706 [Trichoderma atroviride]